MNATDHTNEATTDREVCDQLTQLLGSLTSGTEYPDEAACMRIVLRSGKTVDVWQSSNDGGFKWAYVR